MPSNRQHPSHLVAVLVLAATSWTVLATSTADGTLYGTYRAQSDCVNPVQNVTISVADSAITSPASYSFTDLGFPTATLKVGQPNTGVVNGANRSCESVFTSYAGTKDNYLYTCTDNGEFACNIYLDSN